MTKALLILLRGEKKDETEFAIRQISWDYSDVSGIDSTACA
jgi:ABC-type transporter Mla MlaB component